MYDTKHGRHLILQSLSREPTKACKHSFLAISAKTKALTAIVNIKEQKKTLSKLYLGNPALPNESAP